MAAMAVILLGSATLLAFTEGEETITRENATTVVNTQQIGKSIRGFRGMTPVKIYIAKNKVVKIEALPNQETPQYFARAKKLLSRYEGMSVKQAASLQVDGVSGATYSSQALKRNVQLGLEYYKQHKK